MLFTCILLCLPSPIYNECDESINLAKIYFVFFNNDKGMVQYEKLFQRLRKYVI